MNPRLYPFVVRPERIGHIFASVTLTAFAAGGAALMAPYAVETWYVALMAAGAAAFAAFIAWDGLKTATHVTTFEVDSVTVKDLFGEHRWARREVIGWRDVEQPEGASPRTQLTRKASDGREEFLIVSVPKVRNAEVHPAIDDWFDGLENLELKERIASAEELEADESYGHTPDERRQTAKREAVIVRGLNWAALAVFFWLLVRPVPYWTAISVGLAFPVAMVLLTLLRRDRWQFERSKVDPRAQTGSTITIVALAVALRAYYDWNFVDVTMLAVFIVVFAVVSVALVAVLSRERPEALNLAAWAFVAALYGYGGLAPLNYWFDPSRAERYRAVVEEKFDDRVRIGAWGPVAHSREQAMSEETIAQLSVGDEVCVSLYRGALRIRSYFVDRCQPSSE